MNIFHEFIEQPSYIYFHKKIDINYSSFVAYCVVLLFEGLGEEESV